MADDDAEARFQKFINEPRKERSLPPDERLRDAFAALLAQGSDQASPVEALWAKQMMQQMPQPQPDPTIVRPREMGDSMTTDLPMRAVNPGPAADIAFPTAPAGAGSPEARLRPALPPQTLLDMFPGALSVERADPPRGDKLPPSPKKKKKGRD
jgi:hypothetical protein